MNEERIKELKNECLRKDGKPRANCDREKLIELVTLQAEKPDGPIVEAAPDKIEKLQAEYDKLVNIIFDRTDEDNPKLREGVTEKQLARWLSLRDMIRQKEPEPERIETKVLKDGRTEVKVRKGPPVFLEGKNEKGWKVLAQIMPAGGKVKVRGYTAFRIARGTERTPYIAPPASNANPNAKVMRKGKPKYDI